MSSALGTVASLWRFPVKSMLGEQPEAVDVTEAGIAGDRAYALSDKETGRIVSAKHPKRWPNLLACRASFVEPPRPGAEPPPARIDLADGTSVTTDAPDVDAVLSRFFGREVELVRASPDDYTIDEYLPDVEGVRPSGLRDVLTEQKIGAPLFKELGLPAVLPDGSLMDLFPLSVMTTSTISHFEQLQPGSRFDVRRFRMNVLVDTPSDGLVENDWIGGEIGLGDEVRFMIALPDPRCVITTLAQGPAPRHVDPQDARPAQPPRDRGRRDVPLCRRVRGRHGDGRDSNGRPRPPH